MLNFICFMVLIAVIFAGIIATISLFKRQFSSKVTEISVKAEMSTLFVRKESATRAEHFTLFKDETVIIDKSTDTVSILTPGRIPRITLFLSRNESVYVGFSEES